MLDERRPAAGDALPGLDEIDGIVTFGGSQSVLDLERDPALGAERELLQDALAGGVPVLGICLGAQLLAHALGAEVRRGPRRVVTWLELTAAPAATQDALFSGLGSPIRGLQWNQDVFELPHGATQLLTGAPAGVAAFRSGPSAWGVQFHPEVDRATLDGWYAHYGAWLGQAGVSEADARAADERHLPEQAELAERLFGAFARVVEGSARPR